MICMYMICKFSINSGQKRFNGVPANSAADSVSQEGFPLGHQILKGAKPPSKNGIKPFWGGAPRPAEGRSGFGHSARRVFCGLSCPAHSCWHVVSQHRFVHHSLHKRCLPFLECILLARFLLQLLDSHAPLQQHSAANRAQSAVLCWSLRFERELSPADVSQTAKGAVSARHFHLKMWMSIHIGLESATNCTLPVINPGHTDFITKQCSCGLFETATAQKHLLQPLFILHVLCSAQVLCNSTATHPRHMSCTDPVAASACLCRCLTGAGLSVA